MSEPTEAMLTEAKELATTMYGPRPADVKSRVGWDGRSYALAVGMVHAAELIEADLANVAPTPLLLMANSSEAAEGIKGGIRYMRARILNEDWLTRDPLSGGVPPPHNGQEPGDDGEPPDAGQG